MATSTFNIQIGHNVLDILIVPVNGYGITATRVKNHILKYINNINYSNLQLYIQYSRANNHYDDDNDNDKDEDTDSEVDDSGDDEEDTDSEVDDSEVDDSDDEDNEEFILDDNETVCSTDNLIVYINK